jgi:hypothetical protein
MLWRLGSILARRLSHPFDLEWMEGATLIHAWRLQRSLPIYVEPGIDFIPFVYPPGYPALLTALAGLVPLDYSLGRAVSLAATLGAAAALVFVVRQRAGGWGAAGAAAAVYLGCYPSSGLFYDLVRSDALAMGLLAWAIALTFVHSAAARCGAALLLALAATVKLQTVAFGLPLLVYLVRRDGVRAGVGFLLLSALPALAFAGAMQWRTDGAFLRWVVLAPASHGMVWSRFFPGTAAELGAQLPVALLAVTGFLLLQVADRLDAARRRAFLLFSAALGVVSGLGLWWLGPPLSVPGALGAVGVASLVAGGVAGLVWLRRRGGVAGAPAEGLLLLGLGAAAVLASAAARGHVGGYVNVLMPLHWSLSLGFGLVLAASARRWPRRGAALASALAILQLALQAQALDASKMAPHSEDRRAGEAWLPLLREQPGPVLSPFAPWLPVQAGHEPSLHLLTLTENRGPRAVYPGIERQFERAVEAAHWQTIVAGNVEIGLGVEDRYRFVEAPALDAHFWPLSGYRVRPQLIMQPR